MDTEAAVVPDKRGGTDKMFSNHVEKPDMLADMAALGTEQEHNLGTMEALKIYRRGVMYCVLITLSIVMRMYDIGIVSTFFALKSFRNAYGQPVPGDPEAGNQISASWQVALGVASLVGQVIGAQLVTYPMERYGRKKTLAGCLILTACFTFMQVFAPSIQVLTASEYLSGVIWGSYQVLIPTYSAELLPTVLRPYLAAYVSINYLIGQFIIAGVGKGFQDWTSQWGYRIPFAIQWIWPVIVIPVVFFTPESPWWLVQHDRMDDASKALSRLSSPHPSVDISRTLAMMQKTDLYERKIQEGHSIWECFKGSNRRRTEIVIMIFFVQDFAQSPVGFTYFLEQLGLGDALPFDLTLGSTAIALTFGLLSAFMLRFFGRRSVYTWGILACCICQLLVGFLDVAPNYTSDTGFAWGQVTILFVAQAAYNLTIGPFCYTILTEVPSVKLRSKTLAISISVDAIYGIVTSTCIPYLVNPSEANARGKSDFLFGGLSIISVLWCFFRLPETKNRTFEELDYMFEQRVPTRGFKKYVIDEEVLRNDLET